jgi:dipeptidyl aminopeptidase/acylaminoacyl peptidase
MINADPADALELAEKGIIYVIPYYNPWAWMNEQAVDFVDEIAQVLCEHYSLEAPKIVSTGFSMGGYSALIYCLFAKITPCACVANCPVCDLVYHFDEREDLPRTFYSAFGACEGEMRDILASRSPYHQAAAMPDIPYTIFHCEKDTAVNIDLHTVKFVNAMNECGKSVSLIRVPHRGHIDLSATARVQYREAILKALED